MLTPWEYRNYTQSPYISIDIAGTFVPNILPGGTLEIYSDVVPEPVISTVIQPIDYNEPIN